MGQKVHPIGIRLGIVKKHTSVWYADKADYAVKLNGDLRVRSMIEKPLVELISSAHPRLRELPFTQHAPELLLVREVRTLTSFALPSLQKWVCRFILILKKFESLT